MIRKILFLSIMATLVATAAWAQTATGTLSGVVVAQHGGQAIASAVVTLEGTTLKAVANEGGRFRIDGVPATTATLSVDAPGFITVRVTAIPIRANETTSVTVALVPTSNFMERVQVTATKTAAPVGEVAAQTNIVDRTAIDGRGDRTLTEAISHVPGAVVSTQLGIFDTVMLRGMPRGDPEFTNTLVLIDGVPQTLSNNGARIVALPINDASSIEIVRGPNSALYGRTAIGGSVNVLTADPTATSQVGVDFSGGQFGTAKGVVHASGPVQTWGGYYVSAGAERTGGFYKSKTETAFVAGNRAVFGKLTFVADPKSFGSVSLNRVVSENSTPTNEPIIDGQFLHTIEPGFERLTSFNIPGAAYHQGETRLTLNYTRALTPTVRLVNVTGYRDVRHEFINDGDFIAGPFDAVAHTVSMYPFSQEMKERIFYQELRAETSMRTGRLRHTILAGGSYERNSGRLFSDFIYNDPALFGFTINYLTPVIPPESEWQHDTSRRAYHLGIAGLFAQDTIEPSDRLLFTVGGRIDRMAMDNSRNGGATIENAFHAFSPKLSATAKLLDASRNQGTALNVYAAYSQSFLPRGARVRSCLPTSHST